MRKLLCFFLLFVLIFCFAACGSEKSDPDTVNGLIAVKDDNGDLTGYERRSYNLNGDISRLDVYDTEQTYLYFILYEYDDNNRLYTETRYKAEGFAEERYVYTYDDNGVLSEKAYETPDGQAQVYRYNTDGEETERLYYGTDEQLSKREVLEDGEWKTYDADGKMI